MDIGLVLLLCLLIQFLIRMLLEADFDGLVVHDEL